MAQTAQPRDPADAAFDALLDAQAQLAAAPLSDAQFELLLGEFRTLAPSHMQHARSASGSPQGESDRALARTARPERNEDPLQLPLSRASGRGQGERVSPPGEGKEAARSANGSLPSPCGRRDGDEGPHPHSLSRREREASRGARDAHFVHSGAREVGENPYSGRNDGDPANGRLIDDLARHCVELGAVSPAQSTDEHTARVRELARMAVNVQLRRARSQPDLLLVAEAAGQRFAISSGQALEVLAGADGDTVAYGGERLMVWRACDWWVRVVKAPAAAAVGAYVVVTVGARRAALAVDRILGVVHAERAPAGALWGGAPGVAAMALVPGGACPLVDLAALMGARG